LGRDRYRILPDADRLPKVGDSLKFDGPEFEEAPFIGAWDMPEPTGRWTVGQEATVAWCVQGHDQELTLLIDGTPIFDEKAPLQLIDLWANDWHLARWRFQLGTASPLPARIRVPRGVKWNRDVLFVTFLIRRLGHPLDPRGFFLRSVTLNPSDEYLPSRGKARVSR
jgi:hypothetical protein